MKRALMDIICCPVCKTDLELSVDKEEGDEILQGMLTCTKCGHPYKIEDGIPNLLPPESK
ncbi:MAG: methytransferase partner Trm112 [Thermoplasmata archaeon]